ncbi:hypothetical protein F183_A34050 [Bryobacterales bacterium F-183]|nr:hypothetical protein F183_A34050 [Bryobacterales bacterium F-183]
MSNSAILIVASEAREFRGILRHCSEVQNLDWGIDFAASAQSRQGSKVVCVANGPGFRCAEKAMQVATSKGTYRAVFSTGFCGGLDPALAVGDVVEAAAVLDVAAGERYRCAKGTDAVVASVDRIAATAEEKAALHAATGASVVEMEAAVVARYAAAQDAAFYCVRAISDTADHTFEIEMNQFRDAEGRFAKGRIVLEALKRPFTRIPGLLALDRNCKLAEDRLGDFFANCNFA